MDYGWVKVHRSILESPYFDDPKTFKMVVYFLLKANHKDIKHLWNKEYILIKRGQFVTGRKMLAGIMKMTEQEVRSRVKVLENTGFITIKSTNKFSIITIVNYDLYQSTETDSQQDNQPLTNKQPSNNQQITTNKNDKKEKNDKNEKKNTLLPNGKGQLIKHYEHLLESKSIKYLPAKYEYINFYQQLKRYESKGASIDEAKKLMTVWFEKEIGRWCGFKLSNFWGDIGKIQLAGNPGKTKGQQEMEDFIREE